MNLASDDRWHCGHAGAAMTTYTATVNRDGRFWLITVKGVGVTQARRLGEAEKMARSLISVSREIDGESFDVTVDIDVSRVVTEAVKARAQLKLAAEAADRLTRQAARELAAEHVPVRDIGTALGISYQRAHQLVSDRAS